MGRRATRGLRAAALTLVAAVLLPGAAAAQDEPPAEPDDAVNPAVAAYDAVILRPLGFATLAVGAVAFVPVAVLTAPNGLDSLRAALDLLVMSPAQYVFQRPLGDL